MSEISEACRQQRLWITTWTDIWLSNSPQSNTHYFPLIRWQLLGWEATLRRPQWNSPEKSSLCCTFLFIHHRWNDDEPTEIPEINNSQSVFFSERLACRDNYASDSDFEGGWSEPGVDGWPHIWHSHGTSERHRAGLVHALHCVSQHPEHWALQMAKTAV